MQILINFQLLQVMVVTADSVKDIINNQVDTVVMVDMVVMVVMVAIILNSLMEDIIQVMEEWVWVDTAMEEVIFESRM